MDLGATIVGIAILVLCSIPFIVISRNHRQRKQNLLQGLINFARKNQGNISRYDVWNKSIIGMDDTTPRIFFAKKAAHGEIQQMISLAEVQKCRVVTSDRLIGQDVANQKVIEKLELIFTHWEKSTPESVVEFYNTDTDIPTLTGELQLAEKWCKMVNDGLATQLQRK